MPRPSSREKIVAAAVERFHMLGYNRCGVQEIVDAAGVPKGSFYNHFKAKETLAGEAVRVYWQRVAIDMLADEAVLPVARIRAHFEHIAALYASFGYERGCLIGRFIQEASELTPAIRHEVLSEVVRWCTLLAAAICNGQAIGEISADIDADRTARVLVNCWGGAASAMKITGSRAPLDDFFAMILPAFLNP